MRVAALQPFVKAQLERAAKKLHAPVEFGETLLLGLVESQPEIEDRRLDLGQSLGAARSLMEEDS